MKRKVEILILLASGGIRDRASLRLTPAGTLLPESLQAFIRLSLA